MYYKIVTEWSFFTYLYHTDTNIFDIPCGTVFTAPYKNTQKSNNKKIMIHKSCFHFSEGAFDTMLWYDKLSEYALKTQIYRIEPFGNVKKARCKDEEGFYQCGAPKIKIMEKQNLDEMYDLAVKEYCANRDRYKNFQIDIDLWKEHKSTIFSLYESYCGKIMR